MNTSNKTRQIVITALFVAIICITTFVFHIPTGFNGGYIHLGDTFIYIAASLLPTPYAMVAAGLGAGLSDALSGGMLWIIPTMIIKPIMVLFFTSKKNNLVCKRNVLAVFIAGFIGVLGYYIAGAIISGNFISPFATLFMELIQPIASGIIFLLAGYALDRIKIREIISSATAK
ncbi:TIGR04002 family protein [Clostridium sp. AL.422]|uniref:TIGR04002 family protein n=1 Tax=Clostridium TaxID=1485 RepID=UPI00293DEA88|nr:MULTISPECIES: TIGR04002 family protein [unclassified Clostridium]MDV4152779.1 TIGR04002 family protein [Clostridium sp. AL.422]